MLFKVLTDAYFWTVVKNTVLINIYNIVLALHLHIVGTDAEQFAHAPPKSALFKRLYICRTLSLG